MPSNQQAFDRFVAELSDAPFPDVLGVIAKEAGYRSPRFLVRLNVALRCGGFGKSRDERQQQEALARLAAEYGLKYSPPIDSDLAT